MKRPGISQPDPAAFIGANLPISPVPSIPEIFLHTAGPASGLWRLAGSREADREEICLWWRPLDDIGGPGY
ncbi:hypothetical protein ACC734_38235, partial [Rhizobium ruizarguesonis]